LTQKKLKVLFLVSEDWYFCSHRLSLACSIKDAGYDVVVATHVQDHKQQIINSGITLLPIRMRRSGINPFIETLNILELIKIYKHEKPDLVHHVALKPVLYGSIAAWVTNINSKINALAGLGYIFTSDQWKAKLINPFIRVLFKVLLNRTNTKVILQNPDDCELMVNSKIIRKRNIELIRGAGVNLDEFNVSPENTSIPLVMLASRMLQDKGVYEFVSAAKLLYKENVKVRFILVGDGDKDNPASISNTQLHKWVDEGIVEWWGRKDNMSDIIKKANIVCLPSYREGLPKVLLEAAACGRAIVATDVPGCREIVQNNYNGLLVPPRNSIELALAIKKLVLNSTLRKYMGDNGRKLVAIEFSDQRVKNDTLALYADVLT